VPSLAHPEHQVSNGVSIAVGATPADRGTFIGAHPDHAGLPPELPQAVGVVNVGCPVATVGIEGCPGSGLNGVGHLGSFGMQPL
jgi:hypothetical protein